MKKLLHITYLPFSHKSVVSIMHEQNIICNTFCRSRGGLSVNEKEGKIHRMIIIFIYQRWNNIWNGIYMNCGYEIKWSYDPGSYERNFCNCVEKPEKFRTSTGFEPVTSRYRCDALTNWAMKPLISSLDLFIKRKFNIREIKHRVHVRRQTRNGGLLPFIKAWKLCYSNSSVSYKTLLDTRCWQHEMSSFQTSEWMKYFINVPIYLVFTTNWGHNRITEKIYK